MKIFTISFYLLLLYSIISYGQPITIQGDIILNNSDVVSIASFNNDTLLGISDDGDYSFIIKSTDAGNHWTTFLRDDLNKSLRELIVFDSATAVAVGSGYILRTTDAGQTWSEVNAPSNFPIYTVCLKNSNTAYVGGDLGRYWVTNDKGLSWSARSLGIFVEIYQIQWLGNDTAFFGTGNGLYYTSNGGNSFSLRNQPIGILTRCMYWEDDLHGMIGNPGGYYLTTDGGYTWNPGPGNVKISHIEIVNDTTLYGYNRYYFDMYRSFDAGLTWQHVITTTNEISSLHFTDFIHGFYSEHNSILITSDTATTWIRSVGTSPLFNGDGYCYNEKILQKDSMFYFYGMGQPLKIIDNGKESDFIHPLPNNNNANDFIDATSGFYIDNGSLYYFTDTGNVTDLRSASTDFSFIAFDSLHLFMPTNMRFSIDGGRTFQALMSGTTGMDIQKVDSLVGFATTGFNLFRTIDGGNSWTNTNAPFDYINFYDSLHGVLYKFSNLQISITNDGGQTFIPINKPTSSFKYVFRINATDLLYISNNDSLYYSTDMGMNFIPILPGLSGTVLSFKRSTNGSFFLQGHCFLLSNVHLNGTITLGVNSSLATDEIIAYPNPSNDFIILRFNKQTAKPVLYSVMDLTGRLVKQGQLNLSSDNQPIISTTGLKDGCYLLSVKDGEHNYQTKFIKNNE